MGKEKEKKIIKGRRSGKKIDLGDRQTGKESEFAYVIKDKAFPDFYVLNTANGWWSDMGKVQRLIDAYKIDANDDEACVYAGISIEQLRYFKDLHNDFSQVKRACYQIQGIKAKKALAEKVQFNPEWYLTRKRKEEYSPRQEITGGDGRELFDNLTKEIKDLGEELRGEQNNDDQGETTKEEEHFGGDITGDIDAGQGGGGNETRASKVG